MCEGRLNLQNYGVAFIRKNERAKFSKKDQGDRRPSDSAMKPECLQLNSKAKVCVYIVNVFYIFSPGKLELFMV